MCKIKYCHLIIVKLEPKIALNVKNTEMLINNVVLGII